MVGCVMSGDSFAASKPKVQKYTRIFYYVEGTLARQSFFTHPSSIDVFAPQAYTLDSAGNLNGSVSTNLLVFAKKHTIRVMPLVTNGSFDDGAAQTFLDSASAEDAAISALITEAKRENYWGWQIDFEQMDASYRDKFSVFVQKVADALRDNKMILSVAVVAQTSDNPDNYPNNLWQSVVGVYDYASLGKSADFVSVMSYDDPFSKGPVAEYSWLKKVLGWGTGLIPPEKLSLGIGLYYWQWNSAGKHIGTGGRKGIATVQHRHKVMYHYSTDEEAPYLSYWSGGKQYTLWYENAQSVAGKIRLIRQYKLHGFSAWALGLELPSVYAAIQE